VTRDKLFQSQGQTLYDDIRLSLTSHRIDSAGSPEPVAQSSFNHLLLSSVSEPDVEIAQVLLSSDAPKLYGFGREHKVYLFQGKILDTNLDKSFTSSEAGADTFTGHSYTNLRKFYEDFGSIAACAQTRSLLKVTYPSKALYGGIVDLNVQAMSAMPHCYEISFSLFVTREYTWGTIDAT